MRFIGFCFFLFISLYGFAQHEIEGQVSDEKGEALTGVTVLLLSENDSTMIGFGITNPDGKFRIENVEKGEYLLQFSFVSYRTTIIEVKSDWTDTTIDVGQHTMLVESELLAEVTVEAERIPLGVKGDTITYNTAAFRTRPGATVEDLLKQLPGIEVGRDGSIKAQGEEVENVLVDGKEFFGKDPKIATQNLEAEAVENVEVFDKASEMAEFTGIDDGNEEKTINLELKEDYKTGGFGRVALAAGSKDRREGKLQYNRFSTQMQASTILSSNNINKQPFSFNEYMQMMGGLANAISNTNGLMNFGEFGGDNQTQGLTDNLTAGLNFNYDFTDKLSLKSHYFYINKQDDLMRDTDTKSFIDGLEYESIGQEVRNNIGQNHRLTSKLLYKSTPLFQILLKNNLLGILKDNVSNSSSQFVSESSINVKSIEYNSG